MIVDAQTRIETASPADADAVLRLLAQNHLPLDGLEDHLATTLVARRAGQLVGSAARSRCTPTARSYDPWARDLQVPVIYLLTTTAERYVPKFGFERIQRVDVAPTCRPLSNSSRKRGASPIRAESGSSQGQAVPERQIPLRPFRTGNASP